MMPANTTPAAVEEDWTKLLTWDVRDAAGAQVTTLDGLAAVLGVDRSEAAGVLLGSPAAATAPAELAEEARAETDKAAAMAGGGDPAPADPPTAPADPPPTGDADADADGDEGADDDADGKAFPWQKGGKDKDSADTGSSTRKVTIAAGAFVSWSGGKGKVEAVITNGGTVPGVDSDLKGTKDDPAAKVRVYEESDGKWSATEKRMAVKTSSLKTIPPLGAAKFGKKDAAGGLVLLVAEWEGKLDPVDHPGAEAVRTVYERGRKSWPGTSVTELSREQWGLERAKAFLEKASGVDTEGYRHDDDLLPG